MAVCYMWVGMDFIAYFENFDYETTIMLFKLMCVIGFEIVMFVYLYWCSKFYKPEDFPGAKPEKAAKKKQVSKKAVSNAKVFRRRHSKGFPRTLRMCRIWLFMALNPVKRAIFVS